MNILAKKSMDRRDETPFAYPNDQSTPQWASGQTEFPNPGAREFWCPSCNCLTRVDPFSDGACWHYRGGCPDCGHWWSNLKPRFKRPRIVVTPGKKQMRDWEQSNDA